ncbi:unnamed protein product [Leptidea sinapis]|uniref:Uncharacterized protein n=1 Tax=Leptidea sinapis TaxID=189913 RepID=A0A5E4QE52_9NEOP|nr:unnamed protein product [Leptidea sinapis]
MLIALLSTAAAAPWRCYRTPDCGTICIGDCGQPIICPPTINVGRAMPPCTGPATIYTPPRCPCPPSPCNPCPPPCNPCPPPCPCMPPCPEPYNFPPPCPSPCLY